MACRSRDGNGGAEGPLNSSLSFTVLACLALGNQTDPGSNPNWKQLQQTLEILSHLPEPHLYNGNKKTYLTEPLQELR